MDIGNVLAATLLLMTSAPACTQPHRIELPVEDLTSALPQLARTENLELLFDQSLVSGISGNAVHDASSPQQALGQLLRGTGLSYSQTSLGTFIIFRDQVRTGMPGHPRPLPIEEVLVMEQRTHNTDNRPSMDNV